MLDQLFDKLINEHNRHVDQLIVHNNAHNMVLNGKLMEVMLFDNVSDEDHVAFSYHSLISNKNNAMTKLTTRQKKKRSICSFLKIVQMEDEM